MARASGWAGQKGSSVLGFSAVTEPVLPVAQLSLSYTQSPISLDLFPKPPSSFLLFAVHIASQ